MNAEEFLSRLRADTPPPVSTSDDFLRALRGDNYKEEEEMPDPVESALRLAGDRPELDGPPVEKKEPLPVDWMKGAGEAALATVAGGLVGVPTYTSGLLEGIAQELMTGGFSLDPAKQMEASKRIEAAANARASQYMQAFTPESEQGQIILDELGELSAQIPALTPLAVESAIINTTSRAMAPIAIQKSKELASAIPKIASKFGRNIALVDPKTGLPTPELKAAMDKRGVGYSLIMDEPEALPTVRNKQYVDGVVDSIIKKKIKDGSDNKNLVSMMLDEKGQIVDDVLADEVVRQGFRPGDVTSAKNANRQTREKMVKMAKMRRMIQDESSKALDFRPADIPGEEVMKRFDVIKDKASDLRKQLDNIVEGKANIDDRALPGPGVVQRLKGLEVDISGVESAVFEGLADLKINIPQDVLDNPIQIVSHLKKKDAFKGSMISKDRTSQKVIRDSLDLLTEGGNDAARAHNIKRQLDTMLDFRKRESGGLTDSGENFAKAIRYQLNQSIRDVSPAYARVNDQLSASLEAMNNLKDAMPRKVNIYSENGSAAIGQELRKLLGNRAVRQDLRNSIKQIDDLSKEFGGVFDTDVNKLVQFSNTLDDRFGATARSSFKGEIESAIKTLDPQEAAKQKALDKAMEYIDKYRGINEEEAFNKLQELLMRE